MVTGGLRLETTIAVRPGIAGARYPTAKAALGAHEMPVVGWKDAVRAPFAIDHNAHTVVHVAAITRACNRIISKQPSPCAHGCQRINASQLKRAIRSAERTDLFEQPMQHHADAQPPRCN